jgi:hypothetical protein
MRGVQSIRHTATVSARGDDEEIADSVQYVNSPLSVIERLLTRIGERRDGHRVFMTIMSSRRLLDANILRIVDHRSASIRRASPRR